MSGDSAWSRHDTRPVTIMMLKTDGQVSGLLTVPLPSLFARVAAPIWCPDPKKIVFTLKSDRGARSIRSTRYPMLPSFFDSLPAEAICPSPARILILTDLRSGPVSFGSEGVVCTISWRCFICAFKPSIVLRNSTTRPSARAVSLCQ